MSDTDKTPLSAPPAGGKGLKFWLIFLALCVSLFLSALEFVSPDFNPTFPTHAHNTLAEYYIECSSCDHPRPSGRGIRLGWNCIRGTISIFTHWDLTNLNPTSWPPRLSYHLVVLYQRQVGQLFVSIVVFNVF